MANTTAVFGYYAVNFTNTNLTDDADAQKRVLSAMAEELGEESYPYKTDLQSTDDIGGNINIYQLNFVADGKWEYRNNLNDWFHEQNSAISGIDGLVISVNYTEYDRTDIKVGNNCLIQVLDGKVITTHEEKDWKDLTPKTYLEAQCGDFWDMAEWLDLDIHLTDEQLEQLAKMGVDAIDKHWQEDFKKL